MNGGVSMFVRKFGHNPGDLKRLLFGPCEKMISYVNFQFRQKQWMKNLGQPDHMITCICRRYYK